MASRTNDPINEGYTIVNVAVTGTAAGKSATSYTTQTLSVSGYTVNDTFILGGGLSSQYAYDIRIGAMDFFSTTYAYLDISTSDTILSICNSGLGLAIGKISEENLFEVGWDAKFHEDTQFIGNATFTVLTGLMSAIFPIGSIRMTTSKVGSGSGSSYKYMTNDGATAGQDTDEAGAHTHTLSGSGGSTGSGNTHSNLQPYITCCFWRRTA